jgi:LacI family transcriptional regulator
MADRRRVQPTGFTTPFRLMPPLGLVLRQSTDITAVDDPLIAKAIQFIRDHACDGIQVTDVLKHVALSRRMLETRFCTAIGKTPHAMISMIRLSRAKELLQQTDLSVDAIAEKAGFQHAEYMSAAFRKAFGEPPGRYRRQLKTLQ